MPISVGQGIEAHEGEQFLATIKLINASFNSCTLLIDDSIQRHTLKIFFPEAPDDILYAKAMKEGDQWLERNKAIYGKLTIPYTIVRWDHWRNQPDFQANYELVTHLYKENQIFQNAVNSAIKDYLQRAKKRYPLIDMDAGFSLCKQYLLEECAVMCLWAKQYDFELYPTGRNQAMEAAYNLIIKPSHPDKLVSVSLKFKSGFFDKEPEADEIQEQDTLRLSN